MANDLDAGAVVDSAKRIPPAGWALIVGAGALIGLYLRNRSSSSSSSPASVGDAAASSATPDPLTGSTIYAPATGSSSSSSSNTGTAGPATNLEWQQRALTIAIAGGADPTTASAALSKFLAGDPLDVTESAILSLVLRNLGQPPEGNPTPVFSPIANPITLPKVDPSPPAPTPQPAPPPSSPPPAPAQSFYYTVVPGDSLSLIEVHLENLFHAPRGSIPWQKIYADNRDVIGPDPNHIFPGQRLLIQ